jgi:medium-chain acyl-[acyl-carrier-protein] hydrolase
VTESRTSVDSVRLVRRFVVGASEAGPRGRVKLACLLDYFQESAAEHAARLGASVLDLIKKKLTWILSRYHVRVFRYPVWGEEVRMTTWPSSRGGLFALREFEMSDQSGNAVAAATSSWMLLDVLRKKPVPVVENLGEFPQDARRAIADDFAPLPGLNKVDSELPFRVKMGDLDWNRHVNHVVYIEWAVESAPVEVIGESLPVEIEVDYRGEVLYGQTVLSRSEVLTRGDKTWLGHQIVRRDDLKELARARTLWRK